MLAIQCREKLWYNLAAMNKTLLFALCLTVFAAATVEAGSFWNKLGTVLMTQPQEASQTVVRDNFGDQLQELDSLSAKANQIADGARQRLETLKASYKTIESTYGALFPADVTNRVATAARATLTKINAKISEGEATVSEMTAKANRMASVSAESATLAPTNENLAKIQELARTMLNDFTSLKAEDKSLTNLIGLALAQVSSLKATENVD